MASMNCELYDRISEALTNYETGEVNETEIYETLCEVQNAWEYIGLGEEGDARIYG